MTAPWSCAVRSLHDPTWRHGAVVGLWLPQGHSFFGDTYVTEPVCQEEPDTSVIVQKQVGQRQDYPSDTKQVWLPGFSLA